MQMTKLFTRYEDGAMPVVVMPDRYEVAGQIFRTKRSALKMITRTADARNWTWDRYFRLGKFRREFEQASVTVFDLFAVEPSVSSVEGPTITTVIGDRKVKARGANRDPKKSDPKKSDPKKSDPKKSDPKKSDPKKSVRVKAHDRGEVDPSSSNRTTKGKGIDLERRGHEVRKLMFAGYGGKIRSAGYDPEEVLQEVYKGILVRNAGACPFDETKAGFGHYVHMLIGCVISNYHRKMQRQRKVEPVADEDAELVLEHAAGPGSAESDNMVVEDFGEVLAEGNPWVEGVTLETKVYPLLRAGYGRSEIAERLGLPKAAVTKILSSIREKYMEWAGHE